MGSDWTALCQRLVPEVLQQRDWRLVEDLPAFFVEVENAIADGIVRTGLVASPEDLVRRATIHLYCHKLYRACGENGTLRQHRAFEELGRHAQGVAFRFECDQEVIQACVQSALAKMWRNYAQIRQPGAILRYVEVIVYREVKAYWRQRHVQEEVPVSRLTMSDTAEDDGDEASQRLWEVLASTRLPDDAVIEQELRDELWQEVHRVLSGHPRQRDVIMGFYLYELSPTALARMLDTSVSNFYVIKSRALKRLHDDETFVQRFGDALAALPGESGGET